MQKDYNRLKDFFEMGYLSTMLGPRIDTHDPPLIRSPTTAQVKIVHSVFKGENKEGDFAWMITKPEYAKSLFIFNDNEEQFLEFFNHKDPGAAGSGNASIRPYQGRSPPRAMGIPTGTLKPYEGYQSLHDSAKTAIDNSIETLKQLLLSGNYDQVIISWDNTNNTLGTGSFKPAYDVKKYIVDQVEKAVKIAPALVVLPYTFQEADYKDQFDPSAKNIFSKISYPIKPTSIKVPIEDGKQYSIILFFVFFTTPRMRMSPHALEHLHKCAVATGL